MTISTRQQAATDIATYMSQHQSVYGDWYVGVASDSRVRLFTDHAVTEQGGVWIYRTCATSDDARAVEDHFLAKGTKGGPGGGDNTTKSVYAYMITRSTIE